MCTQAQKPKLTHPSCPRICYPSVSLHLSSLIHLSTFCHLSGRERKTDRERKEKKRETVKLLAGMQEVWTDTGGCGEASHLHSLLYISHPVYQSVHLTQPLHFFFLIHHVFSTFKSTYLPSSCNCSCILGISKTTSTRGNMRHTIVSLPTQIITQPDRHFKFNNDNWKTNTQ